ncbi:MAG: hypothetical protein FWB96_05595 [Defluviitaleaceae bacterium]|nr:hypothetical protein [Defluviitaleaceae bacterium]MCL2262261.1 hypothetical protein [Defluviitaleaceae bacterium]
MSEVILDTKTLPAPLFDMIKTRTDNNASAESALKMERLRALCGSCTDLNLTVDSFLAMTHDGAENL